MKVQFKRNNGGKILMSDIFNLKYIPYRIGDVINIRGLICRKYTNGDTVDNDLVCDDLVKVRDPENENKKDIFTHIYKAVKVIDRAKAKIVMEQIL